eukprot:CAMPEP_0175066796 /NCGR_PEP_ID=MMETSP0052_2-20121109/16722_1 /TAXON_ID=51329 ORGANISM="Polytomella parva, Strain SAG 63-3" /NCGR_SAMPLE_ID=MMETSP0052_2 /ASSEMBLY_ACC=CAM_ASM_000194 /LENGTH=635 /DNA_ID=CAMNT_0016333567 /DNA_START=267 /DNA_END=2170 /DNA_ORIENTATION=+
MGNMDYNNNSSNNEPSTCSAKIVISGNYRILKEDMHEFIEQVLDKVYRMLNLRKPSSRIPRKHDYDTRATNKRFSDIIQLHSDNLQLGDPINPTFSYSKMYASYCDPDRLSKASLKAGNRRIGVWWQTKEHVKLRFNPPKEEETQYLDRSNLDVGFSLSFFHTFTQGKEREGMGKRGVGGREGNDGGKEAHAEAHVESNSSNHVRIEDFCTGVTNGFCQPTASIPRNFAVYDSSQDPSFDGQNCREGEGRFEERDSKFLFRLNIDLTSISTRGVVVREEVDVAEESMGAGQVGETERDGVRGSSSRSSGKTAAKKDVIYWVTWLLSAPPTILAYAKTSNTASATESCSGTRNINTRSSSGSNNITTRSSDNLPTCWPPEEKNPQECWVRTPDFTNTQAIALCRLYRIPFRCGSNGQSHAFVRSALSLMNKYGIVDFNEDCVSLSFKNPLLFYDRCYNLDAFFDNLKAMRSYEISHAIMGLVQARLLARGMLLSKVDEEIRSDEEKKCESLPVPPPPPHGFYGKLFVQLCHAFMTDDWETATRRLQSYFLKSDRTLGNGMNRGERGEGQESQSNFNDSDEKDNDAEGSESEYDEDDDDDDERRFKEKQKKEKNDIRHAIGKTLIRPHLETVSHNGG